MCGTPPQMPVLGGGDGRAVLPEAAKLEWQKRPSLRRGAFSRHASSQRLRSTSPPNLEQPFVRSIICEPRLIEESWSRDKQGKK